MKVDEEGGKADRLRLFEKEHIGPGAKELYASPDSALHRT